MFKKILPLLLLAFLSAPSWAESKLGLGVGLASGQSPYKQVSTNNNLLPAYITYEANKYYFRGIEGGYYVWQQPQAANRLKAAVLFRGRLEGYSISDSKVFAGMQSRDWSLDAGLSLNWQYNWQHHFTVKALSDTLGKHQGQEVNLGYAYAWPINNQLTLYPAVSVNWYSAKLLNYYFGVEEHEALAGVREATDLNGGLGASANFLINYKINTNTSLLLVASNRQLPTKIKDSPLVARTNISSFFGAINFSF